MVEVYARPLSERFIASRWSLAYLFRVAYYIALTIPPIYIAYSTGDFWVKTKTYLEQPTCTFTKSLVFVAYAADGSRVLQYSTIERYNYLLGYDVIRQPSVRSWPTDVNLDAKPDFWDVNLVFPLYSTDASIVSTSMLLFFQVTYQEQVSMNMNAMVPLQRDGGVAGNKWVVAGDLNLFQRNPLHRHHYRSTYQYPLLNDSVINVLDDIDFTNLMTQNEARNESLHLDARQTWSTSPSSSFNVSLHLTVPTSTVSFIPSAGEVVKFAFIQWLAMFWMVYFGLNFVREFVFAQNIVDTLRVKDGTPANKVHQF